MKSDFLNYVLQKYHAKRALNDIRGIGFLFVDIPRTGSTSMRVELAEKVSLIFDKRKESNPYQIIPPHSTSRMIKGIVGPSVWRDLFTFAFIRNPYDRVYSIYSYLLRNGKVGENVGFNEWCKLFLFPSYEWRNLKTPYWHHAYYYPCFDYIAGPGGEIEVSYVAYYERREEEVSRLSDKLGVHLSKDRWEQRTMDRKRDYRLYYDALSVDIITCHFWKDIEAFGYAFE